MRVLRITIHKFLWKGTVQEVFLSDLLGRQRVLSLDKKICTALSLSTQVVLCITELYLF